MASKLNKVEISALAHSIMTLARKQYNEAQEHNKQKYLNLFYCSKEGKVLKKAKTLFNNLSTISVENQQMSLLGYKPLSTKELPNMQVLINEITLLNAKKLGMEEIITMITKKYKVTL